jgi:hypothetical protein
MRFLACMLLFIVSFGYCAPAESREDLGPRKIIEIGCHHGDGTCFVTLEGAPFGATLNCVYTPTTQFRFDNSDTPIGRRTYAAMLAAKMADKPVHVVVSGCSIQGWPGLSHWWIS